MQLHGDAAENSSTVAFVLGLFGLVEQAPEDLVVEVLFGAHGRDWSGVGTGIGRIGLGREVAVGIEHMCGDRRPVDDEWAEARTISGGQWRRDGRTGPVSGGSGGEAAEGHAAALYEGRGGVGDEGVDVGKEGGVWGAAEEVLGAVGGGVEDLEVVQAAVDAVAVLVVDVDVAAGEEEELHVERPAGDHDEAVPGLFVAAAAVDGVADVLEGCDDLAAVAGEAQRVAGTAPAKASDGGVPEISAAVQVCEDVRNTVEETSFPQWEMGDEMLGEHAGFDGHLVVAEDDVLAVRENAGIPEDLCGSHGGGSHDGGAVGGGVVGLGGDEAGLLVLAEEGLCQSRDGDASLSGEASPFLVEEDFLALEAPPSGALRKGHDGEHAVTVQNNGTKIHVPWDIF